MNVKELRAILTKFKDDVPITINLPSYTIKTRRDLLKVIVYDDECVFLTENSVQGEEIKGDSDASL
jgi:hypothetical protein